MRTFTEADVRPHGCVAGAGLIQADREELVEVPLDWQKRGLQQTASGYGSKLITRHKISFCGKLYRVYCTCFSNSGSCWFTVKGRKIFIH